MNNEVNTEINFEIKKIENLAYIQQSSLNIYEINYWFITLILFNFPNIEKLLESKQSFISLLND